MAGNTLAIVDSKHLLTDYELMLCGSFPTDYNFGKNKAQYLIGMSVPPVMTAQIANQVNKQWLKKLQV